MLKRLGCCMRSGLVNSDSFGWWRNVLGVLSGSVLVENFMVMSFVKIRR